MVDVVVDVTGDKQIETAVAVIVAEGGAGGPVAKLHPGLFGDVGKGAVVIVAVEAIPAEVRHKNVGPAIVVVVADGNAEAPAIVGDAGLLGDVGEGAVVVVVEERGVGRGDFAGERVVRRSVDEIDVEPAVVVVVEQADSGAVGLEDELLFRRAHVVGPGVEPCLVGHILKNDGAFGDEAAGGDGAILRIVNGGMGSAGAGSAHGLLLRRGAHILSRRGAEQNESGKQYRRGIPYPAASGHPASIAKSAIALSAGFGAAEDVRPGLLHAAVRISGLPRSSQAAVESCVAVVQ